MLKNVTKPKLSFEAVSFYEDRWYSTIPVNTNEWKVAFKRAMPLTERHANVMSIIKQRLDIITAQNGCHIMELILWTPKPIGCQEGNTQVLYIKYLLCLP